MSEKEQYLKDKGFNFEQALSYLGDMETFNEILKDFYDGLDNQMQEIEKYKQLNDMPNYAILVHALKSNCRSLGIIPFAYEAYKHELAGKDNNATQVSQEFDELYNETNKIVEIVKTYLSK